MNSKRVKLLLLAVMTASTLSGCGKKSETSEPPAQAVAIEEPAVAVSEVEDSNGEEYDERIEELDQYMADQDFDNLFSVYSDYKEAYPDLSDKLEAKKMEYISQIKTLFDGWIAEADDLTVSGNKEDAKQKIDDIAVILILRDHFEELEVYHKISSERLSYYYEYNKSIEPMNILGMEFDMGDGCFFRDKDYGKYNKYEDRYGHSFDEYYELQVSSSNADRLYPYVVFNADNQYDIFHAEFVSHDRMKEYNEFHIEVFGDDTQLYVSDTFTSYHEPMAIDIDITGYRLIKFVAVQEDYNKPWGEGKFPSVGLYQASFLHSEAQPFEYYTPQETN